MRFSFLPAAGLTAAALLMVGPAAFAQEAATAPAPLPAEAPTTSTPTPDAPARPRPLLMLGTGFIKGSGYGGYSGLSLPLILGVEQQLAPGWSVNLNGASFWNIGQRSSIYSRDRAGLRLQGLSVGAGVRHYYHQEQRQAAGRRTGPYQGPYLALQLNNYFDRTRYTYDKQQLVYDYSALMLQWGVQRRLGGRGLLDAYIGGGLANPRTFRYTGSNTGSYERELGLSLELGVKISLTNK